MSLYLQACFSAECWKHGKFEAHLSGWMWIYIKTKINSCREYILCYVASNQFHAYWQEHRCWLKLRLIGNGSGEPHLSGRFRSWSGAHIVTCQVQSDALICLKMGQMATTTIEDGLVGDAVHEGHGSFLINSLS